MGFTYGFRRILKRMHKRIQEADGRLRVCLSERLSGMLVIRIFGQEKSAAVCSSDLMCEHKSARMQRNHFANLCNIGFSAALNGLYILGAFFCGYGILNGAMSYGDFTAVLQLIGQIQPLLITASFWAAPAHPLIPSRNIPARKPAAPYLILLYFFICLSVRSRPCGSCPSFTSRF